jgi:transaldolase
MNQLDALKQFTTVVADTGDFLANGPVQAPGCHHQPLADPQGGAKAEYAPLLATDVARFGERAWTK